MNRPSSLRVLILGGTAEATELACRLAHRPDFAVTSSLAGRTLHPFPPSGPVRIGGFGGVQGLVNYLRQEHTEVIVDATHPFAVKISANAQAASQQLALPIFTLVRSPWVPTINDNWISVPDIESARSRVDCLGGRVFLAIGRQQLGHFTTCINARFLIRAIDPPDVPLPPNSTLLLARGPFALADELRLLREHAIESIVSKNSGGPATYAKIEAARQLGLPVVMIERPPLERMHELTTVDHILAALDHLQQRRLS